MTMAFTKLTCETLGTNTARVTATARYLQDGYGDVVERFMTGRRVETDNNVVPELIKKSEIIYSSHLLGRQNTIITQ